MKFSSTRTSATYTLPDPGELDQRIRLRQRSDVPSSDYSTEPEYQNIRDVWAKVRQVGATTWHESAQTDQAVTHYFTIRYRRVITSDFEIVHDGNVYGIKRLRDLNSARRYLLLECEEKGNEIPSGDMYG